MPEMKTVSAREVIADIRVGLTDEQLMAKHQLSVKGLQSLKNKLLAAGLLTQVELDANTSPGKAATPPVDKKAFARNIAEAVKTGMSDAEIMKKFGIPAAKLPGVFASLVKAGYLAQEDLDRIAQEAIQQVDVDRLHLALQGVGQEPPESLVLVQCGACASEVELVEAPGPGRDELARFEIARVERLQRVLDNDGITGST